MIFHLISVPQDIFMVIQYNTCVKWAVKMYFVGVSRGSPQHPNPKERIQGGGPFLMSHPVCEPIEKWQLQRGGPWREGGPSWPQGTPGGRYGSSEPSRVQNGQELTDAVLQLFVLGQTDMASDTALDKWTHITSLLHNGAARPLKKIYVNKTAGKTSFSKWLPGA